ncbi:hypothetical protein, partial [Lactobacillus delbrueckii]
PAVNGTIAESFLSLSVIYTSFYTEPKNFALEAFRPLFGQKVKKAKQKTRLWMSTNAFFVNN